MDAVRAGQRAPELVAERVLRQSMWDFVVDETTRQLYADILQRVRKGANAQFPLRCDAPDTRRHLRMLMSGGWGVEDAIARLGLFEHRELPALTHGMCARCLDEMASAFDPSPVSHTDGTV